jgi:superfamily II DNA or RNA helicase
MNNDFKRWLYNRYYDISADFAKIEVERQYERKIAEGVRAEEGEDYYIFLYTIVGQRSNRYESLVMLYNRFDPVDSIDIRFSDPPPGYEARDKLTRTAVYFLRNKLDPTLDEDVFNMPPEKRPEPLKNACAFAEELRDNHRRENEELARRFEELHEKGAVSSVEVETEEVVLPGQEDLESLPGQLKDDLLLLRGEEKPLPSRRPAKARAGLCLEIERDPPRLNFFPVLVPVLKRGGTGKPRRATRSLLELYDIDTQNLPGSVNRFLEQFLAISAEKTYDPLKTALLNSIFFDHLAGDLHKLPRGQRFYIFKQPGLSAREKKYQPLNTRELQKIIFYYAPSLERHDQIEVLLELIDPGGRSLKAGNRFEIKLNGSRCDLFFTTGDGAGYLAAPPQSEELYPFFRFLARHKTFETRYFREIRSRLEQLQSRHLEVKTGPLKKHRLRFRPDPILKLIERNPFTDTGERLKLEFDYKTPFRSFMAANPDLEPVYTQESRDPRNREFELFCLRLLSEDPMLEIEYPGQTWNSAEGCRFFFPNNDALEWLTTAGARYLERGFKLFSNKWNRAIGNVGGQVRFGFSYGMEWLEFKPVLIDAAGGKELEIKDIDLEQGIIIDKNNTLHLVTPKDIEKLKQLNPFAEKHGSGFRVPSANYLLIDELYDERWQDIPELAAKRFTAQRLKGLQEVPGYPLSKAFNGTLREYQRFGYRWLRFMHEYHFSGCLADDMGLGKTVQTLALLQSLKSENKLKTSLLVAPVSAVPNWEIEIQRFTPRLTAHLHVGVKRLRDTGGWRKLDLVITSYATLRQDIEMFKDFSFDYLILDESQNIKNAASQVSKAVKVLTAGHRLALSGTPVENNTLELWSLFDFLMPGFLGPLQWFNRQFAAPIEKEQDTQRAAVLKKMIFPFILRRKKEEVETQLPEKIEILSRLEMNEAQMALYSEVAEKYKKEIAQEIDKKGVGKTSVKILEALMRLRQVCLFPRLVHPDYQDVPSAKFAHFLELMEDILAEGHKVLVFSQFVKVLHILRDYFDREDIHYSYLDGSTKMDDRREMIRRFQEEDAVRAFLLSLKAGGTAINLTAADYVIIFDPWWNPAVEDQAVDRSHRIGQTSHVIVYRLVTAHSIEEKMVALQQKKKELVDQLITTDAPSQKFKHLSKQEILDLFKMV